MTNLLLIMMHSTGVAAGIAKGKKPNQRNLMHTLKLIQKQLTTRWARFGVCLTRTISTYLFHKAGYSLKNEAKRAVTLIQCFGSALNINVHLHTLFLDGAYAHRDNRPPRFQHIKTPNKDELKDLVQMIGHRVGRYLGRTRLLDQDN